MSLNDPIADMLTRIRNANAKKRKTVSIPSSRMKIGIAEVLQREGFIADHRVEESSPAPILRLYLKYGDHEELVIRHIERVSKGGKRVYRSVVELEPVLKGLGISVLSTNKGILIDREARKHKVGGEVLCQIW